MLRAWCCAQCLCVLSSWILLHTCTCFLTLCAIFDFRHVHICYLYPLCVYYALFSSLYNFTCVHVCAFCNVFLIFSPPALVCGTCLPPLCFLSFCCYREATGSVLSLQPHCALANWRLIFKLGVQADVEPAFYAWLIVMLQHVSSLVLSLFCDTFQAWSTAMLRNVTIELGVELNVCVFSLCGSY